MENKDFVDVAICGNCKYYIKDKKKCGLKPILDEKGKKTEKPLEEHEHCADWEEKEKVDLQLAYDNIIDLLKKYCDLNDDYYPIIAVWIIGTYLHDNFRSYPYLFLNAMRGSGKSRTLKLITDLSKNGEIQMSMTEAVLFRTKGTIGIDEFEGLGRKGNENLRELLNASYKKGTKVKRMKQKKGLDGGMEQVVEEFDVYRPIVMANIWGMEEVLGDRCISLVLERSNNPLIVKLQEIWDEEKIFKDTKKILDGCIVVHKDVLGKGYIEWNNFVTSLYTTTTTTHSTHSTHLYTKLFKRLNLMDLDGRGVELCFPLFLISWEIGGKVFEELYNVLQLYTQEKKEEQFAESRDVSFFDYVSQETETTYISVKQVCRKFKEFLQYESSKEDDWLNPIWTGKALKRLKLRKSHKRVRGGVNVILNIKKAQEKIRMFK